MRPLDVVPKKKAVPSAEEAAAKELVRLVWEQGVAARLTDSTSLVMTRPFRLCPNRGPRLGGAEQESGDRADCGFRVVTECRREGAVQP